MTLTTGDLKAIKGIVQEETVKIVRSELRGVINGQSAMKAELLGEIRKTNLRLDKLEEEMRKGFKNVNKRIDNLTKRVDKLGLQIAKLEDDTPTIEEFDKLEKRVFKLEQKALQTL